MVQYNIAEVFNSSLNIQYKNVSEAQIKIFQREKYLASKSPNIIYKPQYKFSLTSIHEN